MPKGVEHHQFTPSQDIVNPDPTINRSHPARRSLSHLWERVGVRVKRKFTTLTFILSLLKEGEEALGSGEAGRESEENCRIRVSN